MNHHDGMQRERTRRSGGFTLIELLGSVVIASIALPGILYATVNMSRLKRVDEQRNLAYAACRSQIERLRNLAIVDLPLQDGAGFAVDVDSNGQEELYAAPDDADGLPGEISVAVQEAAGGRTLYRVGATVRWSGAAGAQVFWLQTFMTSRRGR
jgi:type II secretory pathway pseudopilin PulG